MLNELEHLGFHPRRSPSPAECGGVRGRRRHSAWHQDQASARALGSLPQSARRGASRRQIEATQACAMERRQQRRATAASLSLQHHGAEETSGGPVAVGRLIAHCHSTDVLQERFGQPGESSWSGGESAPGCATRGDRCGQRSERRSGGCLERRFGPGRWSEEAVVVLEQPRSDQPCSGRTLRGVDERLAGAGLPRACERAVQHRGGNEVERLAVVPQAAGNLPVVEEPWSRSERVGVDVPSPSRSGCWRGSPRAVAGRRWFAQASISARTRVGARCTARGRWPVALRRRGRHWFGTGRERRQDGT